MQMFIERYNSFLKHYYRGLFTPCI